jgi:hypothetical protein
MKLKTTHAFNTACVLLSIALGPHSPLHAQGIPEPPETLYGTIRNIGSFNFRVTAGTLLWRVTKLTNGVPAGTFTNSVALGNILGQFSYVIQIPCESDTPTTPVTNNNAIALISSGNTYQFDASVDGYPCTFVVPAQATFSATPQNRARVTQIDLTINAPCADKNNNGICDWWEDYYFGDYVNANADPDGDGMSNLGEFLSGTVPTNSYSVFAFVDYSAQPGGGYLVQWNSSERRSYTLLRTSQLLSTNANFSVIRSNIAGTPPRNLFLDTNAVPPGPYFYRLKLEL